MAKTRIGVYGSLLSGLGNHRVIGRHLSSGDATLVGETKIKAFDLYPVAGVSFPGIKRAPLHREVTVEVYEVEDNVLSNVRALEGYNPERTHNSFYDEVDAETLTGETIRVYLYQPDVTGMQPIPNGNWRHYLDTH